MHYDSLTLGPGTYKKQKQQSSSRFLHQAFSVHVCQLFMHRQCSGGCKKGQLLNVAVSGSKEGGRRALLISKIIRNSANAPQRLQLKDSQDG